MEQVIQQCGEYEQEGGGECEGESGWEGCGKSENNMQENMDKVVEKLKEEVDELGGGYEEDRRT